MNKWFVTVIVLLALVAIASNFYIFYIKKNYTFDLEAPCNEQAQTCFVRDCSDDSCPPNGLSIYRVFNIKASDFSKCTDDSCLIECTSGIINCEEISCDASAGDTCTSSFN